MVRLLMVQTRSNSGSVENQALSQALGGDNGTAESSSHGTVPEAPQEPARGDTLSVGKGVQLPDGQQASKNPGAIGVRDPMEVDAPPGNEKFGREDEIATEIERLKKEQKKVQMRTKLRHLKKHKARGFVKDVPEQESYAQRLALERAKKVRNPNVYLGKSQCALDKYVS